MAELKTCCGSKIGKASKAMALIALFVGINLKGFETKLVIANPEIPEVIKFLLLINLFS